MNVHEDVTMLAGLNPQQKEAVLYGDGPLLVIAGAGSGKTRVITYRIAHLISRGVSPWNILAVTFTNKASEEMRRRIDFLVPGEGRSVWISTFHSFCAKLLRIEAKAIGLKSDFTIYDDNDQKSLVKDCLEELNLDEKKYKPAPILNEISRAKDNLLDAESYSIHSITHDDPVRRIAAAVYGLYQKKLKLAYALDFGDLLMLTVHAFRDIPALREKYVQRFKYILLDEYQDTNHAQHMLAKYLTGQTKNICAVGDDDQSIYSWRGANLANILNFDKDFPGAKVIKLEQNYRSTQRILDIAWKVVSNNRLRMEKKLWTTNAEGLPVRFLELPNELEEARFIATEIKRLLDEEGKSLGDMAVFYRINAQSRTIEDALRMAGLPYIIVGSVKFYERQEIKDVIAYLRVFVNPADSLSLKRILNVPPRGIGKGSMEILETAAAGAGKTLFDTLRAHDTIKDLSKQARAGITQFMEMFDKLSPYKDELDAFSFVCRALEETGYLNHWKEQADSDPEAVERLNNLQEFVNAVREFVDASEDKRISAFLEQVALVTAIDQWKSETSRVTLMTVHLAKGLEFPVVFTTGLEEGLFPIGESAFSEDELEEERRLCYVGMTRAKEKLILTSAASRKIFGKAHFNTPSRFIAEAGLSSANPTVSTGRRIRHPDFGEGIIIRVNGTGDNARVTIKFAYGDIKEFMLKYAPLEMI